jgi:hypothetical protein
VQPIVIIYDVTRAAVFREKIALRAAVLPILMRERQMVMIIETIKALRGMSWGRIDGARPLENGTPLFRAKAQSWREAVARTAMELAVRLITMMAVMAFVAVRLPVAL